MVALDDLRPTSDPLGGAGRRVFGADAAPMREGAARVQVLAAATKRRPGKARG
ncbi:MAG: hypothetical protein U0P30_01515 [Vicinamibacterales bacterium]